MKPATTIGLRTPQRMCVACRKVAPQAALLRVALCPSEPWLRLDVQRRHGGRGFYIHPVARCVAGLRRGQAALNRGRTTLVPPDERLISAAFESVRVEIGHQLSETSISSTEKSKNVVDHRSEDASV